MGKRVVFVRVPTGSKLQGIHGADTQYLVEGQEAKGNEGGGRIGRMELAGGQLYIRKVDKDGKPWRDFGTVAVRGDKKVPLIADGIAVSAQGYVVVFNDEKDEQKGK
jgi:hypothetical protein